MSHLAAPALLLHVLCGSTFLPHPTYCNARPRHIELPLTCRLYPPYRNPALSTRSARRQGLQNQRADAIQLLLSSHGGAGEDHEPRERIHAILTMLTDESLLLLQTAPSDLPSSPLSPSRVSGAESGVNISLLKRLVKMIVVASRQPRALVWLQENRGRWVWMQKQVRGGRESRRGI